MIPGSLTLDNDSEIDQSKLAIREKLLNVSTTRNIRNKTIDVPNLMGGQDFLTAKKQGIHGRSTLGNIHSSATRKIGAKKGSLPAPQVLQLASPKSSKPTLFVENSEAQLQHIDHGNVSLPQI